MRCLPPPKSRPKSGTDKRLRFVHARAINQLEAITPVSRTIVALSTPLSKRALHSWQAMACLSGPTTSHTHAKLASLDRQALLARVNGICRLDFHFFLSNHEFVTGQQTKRHAYWYWYWYTHRRGSMQLLSSVRHYW